MWERHDNERTGRDSSFSAPAGYLPSTEDDCADYDKDQEDSLGTYGNEIDHEQGKGNQFEKQQVQAQSADGGYGAPGQGQGNNNFQTGQNQRR